PPRPGARPAGPKPARRTELGLLVFGALIITATYVLASIGTTSRIPPNLGPFLGIVLGLGLCAHVANRILVPDANPVILPIATLLNGIGYVMLAEVNDNQFPPRLQAAWIAIGIGAYVLTLLIVKRSRDLDRYRYILLLLAVALMLAPLIPHIGENINGARLWVKIGPVNGQPVELAKILLCIFFASYFSEKRELLSVPTARVGNRLVLDPRALGPILITWGFAMLVLAAEHDVGFALLIFVLFISMLWVATGRWRYILVGLVLFAAGTTVAGRVFSQVHQRITEWLHPSTTGQLMAGLFGLGSGGLIGTGLGFGDIRQIPEWGSDYIFAAIGTEWGLLGASFVLFGFLLMVGAGFRIAQTARSDFAKLTAVGLSVIVGLQAFFIMAGIVRLLPLTGITLPFMAYGGSSLIANYVLIALLMRISDEGSRPTVAVAATATRVPAGPGIPAEALGFSGSTN
ncbi:MAG TPA: FtsW/RodA/SpoVE family cell cycle protein, partial [Acidimicrobiales bacterium]|nr:FtsW/RodA/SpoVE family cell cycle protein [Acidimicrobiales bacterium]